MLPLPLWKSRDSVGLRLLANSYMDCERWGQAHNFTSPFVLGCPLVRHCINKYTHFSGKYISASFVLKTVDFSVYQATWGNKCVGGLTAGMPVQVVGSRTRHSWGNWNIASLVWKWLLTSHTGIPTGTHLHAHMHLQLDRQTYPLTCKVTMSAHICMRFYVFMLWHYSWRCSVDALAEFDCACLGPRSKFRGFLIGERVKFSDDKLWPRDCMNCVDRCRYTNANVSGRMPCADVADAIVETARATLIRAMQLIEQTQK